MATPRRLAFQLPALFLDGCAVTLMFRAVALTLRAGLHSLRLFSLMAAPCRACIRSAHFDEGFCEVSSAPVSLNPGQKKLFSLVQFCPCVEIAFAYYES